MTTYYCLLSDGITFPQKAHSAADAIQTALEKNIGRTIVGCRSGHPYLKFKGVIEYDIPKHVALTESPKKRQRKEKISEEDKAKRDRPADWIEDFQKQKENELGFTD
jgi:hypothetical protein